MNKNLKGIGFFEKEADMFLMLSCSGLPLGNHMQCEKPFPSSCALPSFAASPVGPIAADQALWYLPVAEPLDISQGALIFLSLEFYFLVFGANAKVPLGIMFIKFGCVLLT